MKSSSNPSSSTEDDYASLSEEENDLSNNEQKALLAAYTSGKLQPFLKQFRKEERAMKLRRTTISQPTAEELEEILPPINGYQAQDFIDQAKAIVALDARRLKAIKDNLPRRPDTHID